MVSPPAGGDFSTAVLAKPSRATRESRAESLAFHFDLGDERDKAITYFERAGDQAQQRVANTAAAIFFQQAIDRLQRADRPQDAVPIYEKLGVALYRAARNDEAIVALERARDGIPGGRPAGAGGPYDRAPGGRPLSQGHQCRRPGPAPRACPIAEPERAADGGFGGQPADCGGTRPSPPRQSLAPAPDDRRARH